MSTRAGFDRRPEHVIVAAPRVSHDHEGHRLVVRLEAPRQQLLVHRYRFLRVVNRPVADDKTERRGGGVGGGAQNQPHVGSRSKLLDYFGRRFAEA